MFRKNIHIITLSALVVLGGYTPPSYASQDPTSWRATLTEDPATVGISIALSASVAGYGIGKLGYGNTTALCNNNSFGYACMSAILFGGLGYVAYKIQQTLPTIFGRAIAYQNQATHTAQPTHSHPDNAAQPNTPDTQNTPQQDTAQQHTNTIVRTRNYTYGALAAIATLCTAYIYNLL